MSIDPNKLVAFLKANKEHMKDGYFGIDMKVSRDGKLYMELDTYKPKPKVEEPFADVFDSAPPPEEIKPEDIPF